VSGGGGRASLLEERFAVKVTAKIKSAEKEYSWIAKVLRAEAGPSNYARFQVSKIILRELSIVINLLLNMISYLGNP
jgi:hypothetical protein